MNKDQSILKLEKQIRQSYGIPEPRQEFVEELSKRLMHGANKGLYAHSKKNFALQISMGIAAVTLVVLFFSRIPQGQVFGQSILKFFTAAVNNIMPGPTQAPVIWVEQTPGVAAPTQVPEKTSVPEFTQLCGTLNAPKCSVEQIREKATFPVYQLAQVPEGLFFIGATGGPDRVYLVYQAIDRFGSLIIIEEPYSKAASQAAPVGQDAEIQMVQIGKFTAEYVEGSYESDGNRDPAIWNSDFPMKWMRWTDSQILFDMSFIGTDPNLQKNDLVELAASLTTESIASIKPNPTQNPTEDWEAVLKEYYGQSVLQVEEEAGFNLSLPTLLPEKLTFTGARFEKDLGTAVVFYSYSNAMTNGLQVSQQPYLKTGDCALCGFQTGDHAELSSYAPGKLVSSDAKVETVNLGASIGEYVEGVWKGTDKGWIWDSDPYLKRLRWQKDEMAYELSYFGMELTKEDLIIIAGNIEQLQD